MAYFWSSTCGTLIPEPSESDGTIWTIDGVESIGEPALTQLRAIVPDWESVNESDPEGAVSRRSQAFWYERAAILCKEMLHDVHEPLRKEIVVALDELFKTNTNIVSVIDRVLVAPFSDAAAANVGSAAKYAARLGFPVVVSFFEELARLQPHLVRVVSHWVTIPPALFAESLVTQHQLWHELCRAGGIRALCVATEPRQIQDVFVQLLFDPILGRGVTERKALLAVSKWFATDLFPDFVGAREDRGRVHLGTNDDDENGSDAPDGDSELRKNRNALHAFQSTQSQVETIVNLVAEGRDDLAQKYLNELIQCQLEIEGGAGRVIKTLCNVAQKSSSIFRLDFAHRALERALEFDPNDIWTLIQFGNHLKGAGNVTDGIRYLSDAVSLLPNASEHAAFAQRSLADAYSKQGEYRKALDVYKQLSAAHGESTVRVAIADNLRWLGDLKASMTEYVAILVSDPKCDRAIAGKAEIAKRRGDLHAAIRLYNGLVKADWVEEHSRTVYNLALCHLFKMTGQADKALRLADEILQQYPFCLAARVQQACAIGILQNATRAFAVLPDQRTSERFEQWLQHFIRGILLLELDRFQEARDEIEVRLRTVAASGEQRDLVRLATIFVLMVGGDTGEASRRLANIDFKDDMILEYFKEVLKLHIAVESRDANGAAQIQSRIASIPIKNTTLSAAVDALAKGDIKTAREIEAKFFLAAA